jgi:putative ABC transport system substrate-binding protein
MRRREFLGVLGGAAAAWPAAVRAQQPQRMRRIGVFMSLSAEDSEGQLRVAAFMQGLQERGWAVGRDLIVDFRWGASEPERYQRFASELVALAPDVILAGATSVVTALQRKTQTVPIVFAGIVDPVGAGLVASLARPGGNATGFTMIEYGTSGKWLELLKEIAPRVTRVAVIRDPTIATGIGQLAALQSAAPTFTVEMIPIDGQNANTIERGIIEFARSSGGGLIVPLSATSGVHRELIISLAAQHRLPAVFSIRAPVARGGLISYGANPNEQFRLAAAYVDRILKGEKPADLPVQAPTKYELVINLKTAKALGLEVPPMLLARADEVIE